MKKRYLIATALLFFLLGSMTTLPLIKADSAVVKITEDRVNVREKPGTSHPVLTQLNKGETMPFEDHKDGWFKITLPNGKKGWVADWLAVKVTGKENQATESGVISVNGLNVRENPSLSAPVIGKLDKGNSVHIVQKTGDWTQITYDGDSAWISSQYVDTGSKKGTTSSSDLYNGKQSHIKILHNGTNIRKKPALQAKVLGTASAGDMYRLIEKDGDWYEIEYKNGKKGYVASWIVSSSDQPEASHQGSGGIAGKTIVLDPGHGGRDQGATGAKGTLEKELTLNTAEILADQLQVAGANVIITRSGDRWTSLQDRAFASNQSNADAFISLHYDSVENNSIHGHTTYYYHSNGKELAQTVHHHLKNAVSLKDRGVRHGDYYVIRENARPALLLELGYMSNPKEEGVIKTRKYQQTAATAIFNGLVEYFSN